MRFPAYTAIAAVALSMLGCSNVGRTTPEEAYKNGNAFRVIAVPTSRPVPAGHTKRFAYYTVGIEVTETDGFRANCAQREIGGNLDDHGLQWGQAEAAIFEQARTEHRKIEFAAAMESTPSGCYEIVSNPYPLGDRSAYTRATAVTGTEYRDINGDGQEDRIHLYWKDGRLRRALELGFASSWGDKFFVSCWEYRKDSAPRKECDALEQKLNRR